MDSGMHSAKPKEQSRRKGDVIQMGENPWVAESGEGRGHAHGLKYNRM